MAICGSAETGDYLFKFSTSWVTRLGVVRNFKLLVRLYIPIPTIP